MGPRRGAPGRDEAETGTRTRTKPDEDAKSWGHDEEHLVKGLVYKCTSLRGRESSLGSPGATTRSTPVLQQGGSWTRTTRRGRGGKHTYQSGVATGRVLDGDHSTRTRRDGDEAETRTRRASHAELQTLERKLY